MTKNYAKIDNLLALNWQRQKIGCFLRVVASRRRFNA